MSLVPAADIEIVDGAAVGNHDAVIFPAVAQDVDEEFVAAAAGIALIAVVCTHNFLHVAFGHECLEGRQVGFPEVGGRDRYVKRVTQGLGTAVDCIVLCAGVSLEEVPVVALKAFHCGQTHP